MATKVKKIRPREANDSPFGFEVVRQYRVMGPSTEFDALKAVDDTTGLAIPQRSLFGGDPLDDNSAYTVYERNCVWENYSAEYGDVWIIRITYRSPQFDVTTESLEWEWDQQLITQQASSDINGNPLINLAGDPLIGGYGRETLMHILRVWFTRTYTPSTTSSIVNMCNASALTLFPGTAEATTIDAEQMKCLYYKPLDRLKKNGQQVRIETAFAFLPGYRPWQLKTPNTGFNSWYFGTGNVSAKGRLHFNYNRQPSEDPVLLDFAGRPLSGTSTYRVTEALEVAIANPEAYPWIEARNVDGGIELIFDQYNTYEFTGFITGVM